MGRLSTTECTYLPTYPTCPSPSTVSPGTPPRRGPPHAASSAAMLLCPPDTVPRGHYGCTTSCVATCPPHPLALPRCQLHLSFPFAPSSLLFSGALHRLPGLPPLHYFHIRFLFFLPFNTSSPSNSLASCSGTSCPCISISLPFRHTCNLSTGYSSLSPSPSP